MYMNKLWIAVCFLLILTACKGELKSDVQAPVSKQLQGVPQATDIPSSQGVDNNLSFIDFDKLSKQALRLTTATGPDYSSDDLETMRQEDWRKDYTEVVKRYTKINLFSEIAFIHSLDGFYNPKYVLVGNDQGLVYRVQLVKHYNYGGIWTVRDHAEISEANSATQFEIIEYAFIDIEEAEAPISSWAQEITAKDKAAEEYYIGDSLKTYILLTSDPGESIEVIDITASDSSISINYANAIIDEEMYGRQPYVLIQFDSHAMDIIIRKYASRTTKDIRPFMP
jgi:hypothetical protein